MKIEEKFNSAASAIRQAKFILQNVLRSLQISYTNGIYKFLRLFSNAIANFTNALRIKRQHDTCVLFAFTVLSVCHSF